MKKRKLKLKKQVWVALIIIIFGSITIFTFTNIKKENKKEAITYSNITNKDASSLKKLGYTDKELKVLDEKASEVVVKYLLNTTKNSNIINLLNEKYYLKDNAEKYILYIKENPTYTTSRVIAHINTHANEKKYEFIMDANTGKDNLILVNKYYQLKSDYEPNNLIKVNPEHYYGTNHKLQKSAYDAFKTMWTEAKKEDLYLIITESYRSYETQKNTYDKQKDSLGTTKADEQVARPGCSDYQTGLSMQISSKQDITSSNFKNTKTYEWLTNNAHNYGFILRYPENKSDITGFPANFNQWRYIGIEAATYIHDNDITLEEYYAYFIEK